MPRCSRTGSYTPDMSLRAPRAAPTAPRSTPAAPPPPTARSGRPVDTRVRPLPARSSGGYGDRSPRPHAPQARSPPRTFPHRRLRRGLPRPDAPAREHPPRDPVPAPPHQHAMDTGHHRQRHHHVLRRRPPASSIVAGTTSAETSAGTRLVRPRDQARAPSSSRQVLNHARSAELSQQTTHQSRSLALLSPRRLRACVLLKASDCFPKGREIAPSSPRFS